MKSGIQQDEFCLPLESRAEHKNALDVGLQVVVAAAGFVEIRQDGIESAHVTQKQTIVVLD